MAASTVRLIVSSTHLGVVVWQEKAVKNTDMDILGKARIDPAPGFGEEPMGAARACPVMTDRQRRRVIQQMLTISLGLSLAVPLHAASTRHPLGPLSQGQRMLIIECLQTITQLLADYVLAGTAGGQTTGPSLDASRRQGATLMKRVRRELFTRLDQDVMERLEARWRTVSDASRTRPSLDIARLMLPMAQEVALPLESLLPPADPHMPGGGEGRARRRLLLSQLLLGGASACWSFDLAGWERLDTHRVLLEQWINAVARQGTDGVRLIAQWNLFASALPLRDVRCLPGAAQTLQSVGERLYKLL
ncbi:MAG: hypothetical protein Q4B13_04330 [Lautropia sp.]|nr:hypothetical protein [Lautropia sp.]